MNQRQRKNKALARIAAEEAQSSLLRQEQIQRQESLRRAKLAEVQSVQASLVFEESTKVCHAPHKLRRCVGTKSELIQQQTIRAGEILHGAYRDSARLGSGHVADATRTLLANFGG
jgi:lipopolysaccharide biosynthesis regulator YciM